MKIGTRTRYGLRTMIEIAQSEHTKGIFQKEISNNQALSNKYLDQIIHALKTSGLISNVKGRKSGYQLTRRPEEITVLDIHRAFEPELCLVNCLSDSYCCDRIDQCQAKQVWDELNILMINYLKSVTLADIINRHNNPHGIAENMPARNKEGKQG